LTQIRVDRTGGDTHEPDTTEHAYLGGDGGDVLSDRAPLLALGESLRSDGGGASDEQPESTTSPQSDLLTDRETILTRLQQLGYTRADATHALKYSDGTHDGAVKFLTT